MMTEHDKKLIQNILSKYSPEEKFAFHSTESYKICKQNKWGNPSVPGRSQEIIMANILGCKISDTVSGADAYDQDGPAEFKSCTPGDDTKNWKKFTAVYGGISVFPTWDEQLKYLDEKILGYKNHYHARFYDGECVEIWKMDAQTVYDLLLPKLKKRYDNLKLNNTIKDPRMQGTLGKKEIQKYGEKVFELKNNA